MMYILPFHLVHMSHLLNYDQFIIPKGTSTISLILRVHVLKHQTILNFIFNQMFACPGYMIFCAYFQLESSACDFLPGNVISTHRSRDLFLYVKTLSIAIRHFENKNVA